MTEALLHELAQVLDKRVGAAAGTRAKGGTGQSQGPTSLDKA
ncbi:hypothetical protein [Xanthomonas arboricola]|nr:hypothetical protein [Xanthomonas arboricola]